MAKNENLQQVSKVETETILDLMREVLRGGISGDAVEFGCYRGDTSLLLERLIEQEFPGSARLWIYDSFEGLPERTNFDASVAGDAFAKGELLVSKREVVDRFKKSGLKVPRIRKGFFENLDSGEISVDGKILRSSNDLPEQICFAFLDGDLYQSIKTSLGLVAPRMTRDENGNMRGVIVVHDYNNPQLPGVARAIDEWLLQVQKTAPLRLRRRESLAIISS